MSRKPLLYLGLLGLAFALQPEKPSPMRSDAACLENKIILTQTPSSTPVTLSRDEGVAALRTLNECTSSMAAWAYFPQTNHWYQLTTYTPGSLEPESSITFNPVNESSKAFDTYLLHVVDQRYIAQVREFLTEHVQYDSDLGLQGFQERVFNRAMAYYHVVPDPNYLCGIVSSQQNFYEYYPTEHTTHYVLSQHGITAVTLNFEGRTDGEVSSQVGIHYVNLMQETFIPTALRTMGNQEKEPPLLPFQAVSCDLKLSFEFQPY